MEEWVPLFEIFQNSPSPERDASLWFQHHHLQNPPHSPSTSSFLSFLLSPTPHQQQKDQQQPIIFIQTLPPFVQSRILSFLTYDSTCFTSIHLRSLAYHIVHSEPPDFWVRRAACHLLDAVSYPFEPRLLDEEFYSLPPFLKETAKSPPLLPWLPLSPTQLPHCTSPSLLVDKPENQDVVILEEEEEEEEEVESCSPLDPLSQDKAIALKASLRTSDSTSSALRIAQEIRNLCFLSGPRSQIALLELIEPWEAEDETSSVLLSNLCDDGKGSPAWPGRVLYSVLLPKLLTLRTPASRVLLLAMISFCKLHPVAAIDALVFPLTLCNEGVNVHICDVLARIVKECLHPSHVSAFCQRLLCGKEEDGRRKVMCLPCHRGLISESVVWTEPMFTLFQHILNRDVYLTPDATRQLVLVIDEVADRFSRSLKFGNFLLGFISKCAHASSSAEFDKILMERVVKKTDTFMTKSILSKLEAD